MIFKQIIYSLFWCSLPFFLMSNTIQCHELDPFDSFFFVFVAYYIENNNCMTLTNTHTIFFTKGISNAKRKNHIDRQSKKKNQCSWMIVQNTNININGPIFTKIFKANHSLFSYINYYEKKKFRN